jgi:hypothetical protein
MKLNHDFIVQRITDKVTKLLSIDKQAEDQIKSNIKAILETFKAANVIRDFSIDVSSFQNNYDVSIQLTMSTGIEITHIVLRATNDNFDVFMGEICDVL